ncbi:putative metabolite transport protein CsbC [Psilocybe cubensis]|uniref:Metabolite transport protein CsbC n=2 Tax=Psilocybe cubensis TaxID=181762 RepID=A0ACB8GJS8_PSICU|nr:putative metabolite transport protein CsbC [Psilocybe cubensis]KAH9475783.1 putative metabolite transport protein CsbC [Psilocybe cubensis]
MQVAVEAQVASCTRIRPTPKGSILNAIADQHFPLGPHPGMNTQNAGYIALSPSNDENQDYPPSQEATLLVNPNVEESRTIQIHEGTFTIHPTTHHYSYAYGPKGLPGLRHNKYALLCAFFASIGGLEFGYDQGVIANVLVMEDFMLRWPVTPLQKGIMTAVLELGALTGALSAGVYADRYSRSSAIIFACVVFCIGSSFQCFAQSLSHIFIGRAIGGLGVGALSMLSPLYMAEISPPEVRGSLMALEQFSIVLGVVFGFWTGFMTRDIPGSMSWRIPLGIQLIPGFVLAAGCAFLPPSPRLLVMHGKYEEARASLARLRLRDASDDGGDMLVQLELLEMRVETTLIQRTLQRELELDEGTGNTPGKTGLATEWKAWKKLFQEKYRDRTWIGVLIMFFQQWSGINALLYYGPTLVHSIGLSGDSVALLVSGGIGVVQLLAVLPAIVWIDRVGRKVLLRGGSIVMTLSHLGISVLVLIFQSNWSAHPFAVWVAVGGIYSFTLAYGISFGPIGWVLPSEVFPLTMRSKGVALSTASNWINNFFIGLLTPLFVDFSASFTFFVFAGACALAYFWATYFVPETANVSLEEVDKLFRSAAGREEGLLKAQIEEELGLRDLVRELAEES